MLLIGPFAAKNGLIKRPVWSFMVSWIWRMSFACTKVYLSLQRLRPHASQLLQRMHLWEDGGNQVSEREQRRQLEGEVVLLGHGEWRCTPIFAKRLCSVLEPL